MFRKLLPVILLMLMLLLFWGCEKSPTGAELSFDEAAIKNAILDNPDGYFTYGDYYGERDVKKAEMQTTWWRQPTSVDEIDITMNIDTLNDSAYVIVSGEVSGIFHIYEYDTIPPDTIAHYMKSMKDNITRFAIFKHYADSIGYRGWRLEKISGAKITSYPNTVGIDSIRIECESYPNTVIGDPLALVDKEAILSFAPGEEVSLTIYSDDNVYAFFHARGHHFGYCRWWRWEFDEAGSGAWSGAWQTPEMPGVRMVAFDILHKNTLDDHEYQYDSNVWVFPYRIE